MYHCSSTYKGTIKCKITSAYSVSVSRSTENVGVFNTSTYTGTKGYLKNYFIIVSNRDYEHAESSVCYFAYFGKVARGL